MSIDTGIDLCAPTFEVFTFIACICVENTSKLDLELDGAIEMEDPVNTVLVVSFFLSQRLVYAISWIRRIYLL